MTVLVTAASKHGSTREIAEAVADELVACGLEAEALPVEEVPGVDGYDAVVLGSAVYAGRWLEAARDFVETHAASLAARPTWLFSSGPIGDPPRPEGGKAVDLTEVAAAVRPREHRIFPGRLVKSELGFADRAIVLAFRAPDGDFRDWDDVRTWAASIAARLEAELRPRVTAT